MKRSGRSTLQVDARCVALDLLRAVVEDRRPLDEALAAHGGLRQLAPRDRGFVRLLVATTLRRGREIDRYLAPLLRKPLTGRKSVVVDVLRLGVAQVLFLETPAHAAVSTSVALVRTAGMAPFAGLVNAVLRRAAEVERLEVGAAARTNTPDWLWASWAAAYGEPAACDIALAHLREPPLDLSAKPGEAASWAARLGARLLPTGSLRLVGAGDVTALPGFAEGAWWVQDAAAALPARLLGDVRGRTVVDLCAAPGGKTAQLAAAGARVIAVDRSERRLARLCENMERLGLTVETVPADAAVWQPPALVDTVLLDAPCTATGTIRRHPDIPWLKGAGDVAAMADVQAAMLRNAAAMLAPGGTLVYATCSLQPEEGPRRIAALLEAGTDLVRVPVAEAEIPGLAGAIDADGDLRTLPCHWPSDGGLDGFFAARLRRAG